MPVALAENQPFSGIFLLKEAPREGTQRDGKPYVKLVLGTPEGQYEGRMFATSLSGLPPLAEGDPVKVEGNAQLYQGRLTLKVDRIAREEGEVDPREIYPSSARSEEEMRAEFRGLVKSLRDPHLRALFAVIESEGRFLADFFRSPAAVSFHHARIGGLAEHSLAVALLAGRMAEAYPWLRTDLVVAGALLHDIGKTREYEVGKAFRTSREGHFLGHIALGVVMAGEWISRVPGFPRELAEELLHILLSHHGTMEQGSPRVPVTPEALVVHYADDLDAKLDMVKSAGGNGLEGEYVHGLRRIFYFPRDSQVEEQEEGAPPRRRGGEQGGLFE